jgi:hypothetical protein
MCYALAREGRACSLKHWIHSMFTADELFSLARESRAGFLWLRLRHKTPTATQGADSVGGSKRM